MNCKLWQRWVTHRLRRLIFKCGLRAWVHVSESLLLLHFYLWHSFFIFHFHRPNVHSMITEHQTHRIWLLSRSHQFVRFIGSGYYHRPKAIGIAISRLTYENFFWKKPLLATIVTVATAIAISASINNVRPLLRIIKVITMQ